VSEVLIRIRVQPGAKRTELAGRRDGALLVRVTAPATEGKANKAACKLLADLAGIPFSRVEIVRGSLRRDKVVRLIGLDPGDAAVLFGYS
jgi:uncharacterized protein (TIGR00251 family)